MLLSRWRGVIAGDILSSVHAPPPKGTGLKLCLCVICQTPLFKKKIHDHAYLNSDYAPSQQHNIPAYNQQGGKSSALQYSLMLNNIGLLDFHTVQTQTN